MLPFPSNHHEGVLYVQKERNSILNLIRKKFRHIEELQGIDKKANLLDSISSKSQSMLIHKGDTSNLSICLSRNNPNSAIQFPGKTLLFVVHDSFEIIKHTTNKENDKIISSNVLTVSKEHPVLIDGKKNLYTFISNNVLVGNLNFPKTKDINMFDLSTGKNTFWFTTDSAVARALFIMKALEELDSSHLLDVAKEYIYHYHPAVAWGAFRIIYCLEHNQIDKYKSVILRTENERINQLIKEYL